MKKYIVSIVTLSSFIVLYSAQELSLSARPGVLHPHSPTTLQSAVCFSGDASIPSHLLRDRLKGTLEAEKESVRERLLRVNLKAYLDCKDKTPTFFLPNRDNCVHDESLAQQKRNIADCYKYTVKQAHFVDPKETCVYTDEHQDRPEKQCHVNLVETQEYPRTLFAFSNPRHNMYRLAQCVGVIERRKHLFSTSVSKILYTSEGTALKGEVLESISRRSWTDRLKMFGTGLLGLGCIAGLGLWYKNGAKVPTLPSHFSLPQVNVSSFIPSFDKILPASWSHFKTK